MGFLHKRCVPRGDMGSLHKRGNSTDSEGEGGNRLRQRGSARISPRHLHGSETSLSVLMMPGLEDM